MVKPVPKILSQEYVIKEFSSENSHSTTFIQAIFKMGTRLAEESQLAELRAFKGALAGRTRTVRVAHAMLSIC